jgi:hypothetical protein
MSIKFFVKKYPQKDYSFETFDESMYAFKKYESKSLNITFVENSQSLKSILSFSIPIYENYTPSYDEKDDGYKKNQSTQRTEIVELFNEGNIDNILNYVLNKQQDTYYSYYGNFYDENKYNDKQTNEFKSKYVYKQEGNPAFIKTLLTKIIDYKTDLNKFITVNLKRNVRYGGFTDSFVLEIIHKNENPFLKEVKITKIKVIDKNNLCDQQPDFFCKELLIDKQFIEKNWTEREYILYKKKYEIFNNQEQEYILEDKPILCIDATNFIEDINIFYKYIILYYIRNINYNLALFMYNLFNYFTFKIENNTLYCEYNNKNTYNFNNIILYLLNKKTIKDHKQKDHKDFDCVNGETSSKSYLLTNPLAELIFCDELISIQEEFKEFEDKNPILNIEKINEFKENYSIPVITGGSETYKKYIKYKNKYIKLKKMLNY